MKTLILSLICLFTISTVSAKYLPGTINFLDGSSKTGLIEIGTKVKFKKSKKSKKETFKTDQIKSLSIKNEKATIKYVSVYMIMYTKKGKPVKQKKRSLLPIAFEGDQLCILYKYSAGSAGQYRPSTASGGYGWQGGGSTEKMAFIHLKGSDSCSIIDWIAGFIRSVGNYNVLFKRSVENYLKDCPGAKDSLNEAFYKKNKKAFKKGNYQAIIDTYEKTCN